MTHPYTKTLPLSDAHAALALRKPQRIRVVLGNESDDALHKLFAVAAICRQHHFQLLATDIGRMREYLKSLEVYGTDISGQDAGFRLGSAAGCLLDGDWIWKEGKRHRRKIEEFIADTHADASGMQGDDDKNDYECKPVPWPLPNIILGVRVSTQADAHRDIPVLLECPVAIRWVACEGVQGEIDLGGLFGTYTCYTCGYRGFESGASQDSDDDACPNCGTIRGDGFGDAENDPACRGEAGIGWLTLTGGDKPLHPEVARSLRNQAEAAGVPFWFEWGKYRPFGEEFGDTPADAIHFCDSDRWRWVDMTGDSGWSVGCEGRTAMIRVGKKVAGRLLDNKTWDGYPEVGR